MPELYLRKLLGFSTRFRESCPRTKLLGQFARKVNWKGVFPPRHIQCWFSAVFSTEMMKLAINIVTRRRGEVVIIKRKTNYRCLACNFNTFYICEFEAGDSFSAPNNFDEDCSYF